MGFLAAVLTGVFVLGCLLAAVPVILQLLDTILISILRAPFRLLGMAWQTQQLSHYEKSRRLAVGAAFIFVICLYVWHGAPGQLPPWGPVVLLVVAGVSVLFVFTGFHGARDGPRAPSGVAASLVVAGGCAALLWSRCYLQPDSPAAVDTNFALAGLYIAVLIAALVRALICAQLQGGAWRFIKRLLEKKSRPMRPASSSSSGFWAGIRDSFWRGHQGRPWRD
jgi:hypothetical protein